jgi:hypothetical protein
MQSGAPQHLVVYGQSGSTARPSINPPNTRALDWIVRLLTLDPRPFHYGKIAAAPVTAPAWNSAPRQLIGTGSM